jgi:hypothetical protein
MWPQSNYVLEWWSWSLKLNEVSSLKSCTEKCLSPFGLLELAQITELHRACSSFRIFVGRTLFELYMLLEQGELLDVIANNQPKQSKPYFNLKLFKCQYCLVIPSIVLWDNLVLQFFITYTENFFASSPTTWYIFILRKNSPYFRLQSTWM